MMLLLLLALSGATLPSKGLGHLPEWHPKPGDTLPYSIKVDTLDGSFSWDTNTTDQVICGHKFPMISHLISYFHV